MKTNKDRTISQNFSLEKQFDFYLEKAGFDKSEMNPVQLIETKKAFFGACGQMLIMFRDGIAAIEDEYAAVLQMEDLLKQVSKFWQQFK